MRLAAKLSLRLRLHSFASERKMEPRPSKVVTMYRDQKTRELAPATDPRDAA